MYMFCAKMFFEFFQKGISPRRHYKEIITCWIVDFAVSADHRVKIKESEKRDKYLDLARELKNYETWKWR